MAGLLEQIGLGKMLGSQTVRLRSMGYQQYQGAGFKGPLGIWPFPILNALSAR